MAEPGGDTHSPLARIDHFRPAGVVFERFGRFLRLADDPSIPRDDGQSSTDFARVTRAEPVELGSLDAPRQTIGRQLYLALEPRRQ